MCFHNAEHDIWACVHACTKKKGKKRRRTSVHTHIHKYTHTSERLCESQNAEPEGCCVSDVCIVYSVVPVHVGDCCTLRPHSGLVLFTMTGVDSRLLSRRAERPSKERGWGWGRQRSKETERDHWLYFFSPIFVHILLLSLFWFVFDPFSSNLCPMGHQLSDSQRRVPPLFLSSLLSLFAIWDTHRFAPGESFGNPR